MNKCIHPCFAWFNECVVRGPRTASHLWLACVHLLWVGMVTAVASRPATVAELELTHTKEHVAQVRTLSDAAKGSQIKHVDADTYYNKHTSFLAELAAGGLIELCSAVVRDELHAGVAVIRPPGHHAFVFCLSSFLFVCQRSLFVNAYKPCRARDATGCALD
jgi:hypothetical protein